MGKTPKYKNISKVLAIIGGVLDIIYAIYGIIGGNLIGILGILFGILTLASTGIVKLESVHLPFEWWLVLILGIASLFTACTIPGVIIIIAGILLLF